MRMTERLATNPEAQVALMVAVAEEAVTIVAQVLLVELVPLVAVQAQVVAEAEKVARVEVPEETAVLAELEVSMYYLLLLHTLASPAVKAVVEAVGLLLAVEPQEAQAQVLRLLAREMGLVVPERLVVHAVMMMVELVELEVMVAEQQVLF